MFLFKSSDLQARRRTTRQRDTFHIVLVDNASRIIAKRQKNQRHLIFGFVLAFKKLMTIFYT